MTGPRRWLGQALLTTLAYAVAGRLALLLAIPPGYATAVWPAAGVALIAVLHGGWRAAIAVAIGSFAVNAKALAPMDLAVAATLAIGAALQASAGAALIRRHVGYPSALDGAGEVMRFLVAGGPVGCLVAATWGVTTLYVAGLIAHDDVAFSWWTWWVGDSIGVVLVAPILLAFVGEPAAQWRPRRATLAVPMGTAFAAVTVLFVQASAWEQGRLERELGDRASGLTRALLRQTERYVDVGVSIASFYQAIPGASNDDLIELSERALAQHPGILAVSWCPRVAAADRAAVEAQLRGSGAAEIWELDRQGRPTRAGPRAEYYPVLQIAPLAANRAALGFDLASEPTRRAAIDRARASGAPTATTLVHLVQDPQRPPTILVVTPVWGPATAVGPRPITGYASTILPVADVVEQVMGAPASLGLDVRLYDLEPGAAPRVLYALPGDPPRVPPWTLTAEVAGRSWRIEVRPRDELGAAPRRWAAWLVLAGGLALVSLLGAILLIVTGREIRVAAAEANYRDLYDNAPDMYVTASAEDGRILDANATTLQVLGRTRLELIGLPMEELYEPDSRAAASAALASFRATGEIRDVELSLRRGDDTAIDVSTSVSAVRDETGAIVRSRAIWRDITARKQEARDRQLELTVADLTRSSAAIDELTAAVATRLGEHLGVSRCFFCEVDVEGDTMTIQSEYRRGAEPLTGQHRLARFSPSTQAELRAGRTVVIDDAQVDPRTADRYATGYQPGGLRALLGVPLTRDGRWVASLWAIDDRPRRWPQRELALVRALADRAWLWIEHLRLLEHLRRINEELEQRVAHRTADLEHSMAEKEGLLREKDVLLREIHHRVKNNLAVISSLLKLQAMATDDDRARHALEESRDRVHSIALVHDQLYRAANVSMIELDKYLRDLVLSIVRAHHTGDAIDVVVEASACRVPLDQAVPCGLIVNELVTNALKHAFPGGGPGTVVISVATRTGELHIVVRDDGVGLPAGFEPAAATTGLGMVVIDTLVTQLDATLAVGPGPGARFELIVPVPPLE